ncbi:MAG: hypothetical protein ABI406_20050 [Ktedonobacteraceae bacterium]
MRAYQLHTTTALAGCCSLLPVSKRLHAASQGRTGGQATSMENIDAERYAVPHSPGRARRFCPYPPDGRRGRR